MNGQQSWLDRFEPPAALLFSDFVEVLLFQLFSF
jgi:hypothetical protein